jgi:hypothetical protein
VNHTVQDKRSETFQNHDHGTYTVRYVYKSTEILYLRKEILYLKIFNALNDPKKNFKNSNSFVIDA